MDWSHFLTGLIIGLLAVLVHRYVKRVKYPEDLEFEGQSIRFRGSYFAGFLSLVFAVGFSMGFLLFFIYEFQFWVYLSIVAFLITGFLHFAYYDFFCRVKIWPDNTIEYKTLFQKVHFHLSEVKSVSAGKTGLLVQFANGKKLLFSTTLDHHENLFGYLYAQAGDKFSKHAKQKLEKGRAFLAVI